jgi:mannose-1-phosphate guanylyltransferase
MNKDHFCIIMAGGIGSRFWPLSRTRKPKQFLDILGTGRTLLQQTFDRLRHVFPVENILIVTNEDYESLVIKQLRDIRSQILLEPLRRNTHPA